MSIHFSEYGDKDAPLLVFLHGGGVSSWMWDKQVQYFNHYHCVAIDLPEQGQSHSSGNFSIKSSAESVIELIEKLAKGKEVIVVGFSLGAQVTIQILSLHPTLVDYAIINSALVMPNLLVKKMIKPSIKLTFPLIKYKSFSKLQAKTLYVGDEYFDTYYQESSRMKSETLVRILEENMSFSLPENFHEAKSKILVTVGEKERGIMVKSAKELVSNNPNAVGIIIPKVGHGVSLLKPEFFNKLIDHWVTEGSLPEDVVMIKR